tara:strand:- start:33049 stop:33987 length:939 start_codon:yes stop_codon:yes gene_type:complete
MASLWIFGNRAFQWVSRGKMRSIELKFAMTSALCGFLFWLCCLLFWGDCFSGQANTWPDRLISIGRHIASTQLAGFFHQYPEVSALLIALIGFLAAYVTRKLANSVLEQLHLRVHEKHGIVDSMRFMPRAVFYLVLGFFLLLALRTLGVTELGSFLDEMILFLPRVLLGAGIILAGYLLGILARNLVSRLLASQSQIIPQLTQYLIFVAAIVTGLNQMAIDVSFLETVIVVILGTLLASLSLAFALGSQNLVANLLARRNFQHYKVGDWISFEGVEGQISELTNTDVVLKTDEGLVIIPARKLSESIVVLKQ